MELWLNLIGLILGMAGTCIVVRGALTTSAAIIKQRWADVEKSWQKIKPSWFQRFTCSIAKKFGSDNPHTTQDYTIESFMINFWAFILLFIGFLLQFIALLIGMGIICNSAGTIR
ncbi:MAG: hypothetical protein AABZ10_12740 [Nitrospirota bacterium]